MLAARHGPVSVFNHKVIVVKVRKLKLEGALEFTPPQHPDRRGKLLVPYDEQVFAEAVGYPLRLGQVNHAVSRKGTIRGVHFAQVPPSQSKYVYCPQGSAIDYIVDIRVGSPTFGQWDAVVLDSVDYRAVYVPEGFGHGYVALEDDTVMVYLCSERYNPAREFGVDPFDAELALPWPDDLTHIVSDRDQSAPSVAEAREKGLLPSYAECQRFYQELRSRG